MIVVSWCASAAAVIAGMLANVNVFSGEALFGIVGPCVIVVTTAALTWTNNRNNRWRDNFNSERAAHELTREESERWRVEAAEQRELRHQLKAELEAEKLKHDFTGVLKLIQQFQEDHVQLKAVLDQRSGLFRALMDGQQSLQEGQQELVRAVTALIEKLDLNGGTHGA